MGDNLEKVRKEFHTTKKVHPMKYVQQLCKKSLICENIIIESMVFISFVSGMIFFLIFVQHSPIYQLIMCFSGAATELFSPSEWDTVTVPAVILAVLLLF